MDIQEAKKLLSYHSCVNSDIHNAKWEHGFLGSLRPFQGELVEDNFYEVMDCIKAVKGELCQDKVDREIISAIVNIVLHTRCWMAPEGMLGRNHLLSEEQTRYLVAWVDIIEETFAYLLDGADDDTAFFAYKEYLDGRYFYLSGK